MLPLLSKRHGMHDSFSLGNTSESESMISVIITTFNQKKIYALMNKFPKDHEIIVSHERGLGYARNMGVAKSQGEKLVFLDDDILVPKVLWVLLEKLGLNELIMCEEASTRITFVSRSLFYRVGGFDERFTVSGEDRDFCLRAIKVGAHVRFIKHKDYVHMPHPFRGQMKRLTGLKLTFQHAFMYRLHGYWFKHIYEKPFRRMFALWSFHLNDHVVSFMFWDLIRVLSFPFTIFEEVEIFA
jgi:glycosyltransferase involved in cell wall biosynthesis